MKPRPTVLFFLLALLFAPFLRAAEPADPSAHYVGMNVWFLTNWDGSNAFADIMMHGREWRDAGWNANAATDAEGWPLEDASTVIFGKDNQIGTYKLVFEGQADSITFLFGLNISGSITNKVYDPATNTTTADVNITGFGASSDTAGLVLTGTRRTPASALNTGFRNLRLYRPGHATDGSELFDQRFLALMAPFQVIRFMDWVDANNNGETAWSERWRPGMSKRPDYTAAGRSGMHYGLPLEYMIALCNELGTDLWLNLPTLANDDYFHQTALAIRYGTDGTNPYTSPQADPVWPPLNPDLKVYLEYSNEIWNTANGFNAYYWIRDIADALIADPTPHPTRLNLATGAYDEINRETVMARYAAWRGVAISDAFRGVFGDAAMQTRVRPILAGQIGGNWSNPRQLPWLETFYGSTRPGTDPFPNSDPRPVNHFFYGGGGTTYHEVITHSTDPDVFFAPDNYPQPDWLIKQARDSILVRNYGLRRVAYEGGIQTFRFGLSGNPPATDAEKLALQADPRMKTLVEVHHDAYVANGGDLLVYYVNTSALDWQFTPNVWNLDTPKLDAARSIINERSRVPVTVGQELPGTLIARTQSDQEIADSSGTFFDTTSGGEDVIGGIDPGEFVAFGTNTRNPGGYRLRLRGASGSNVTAQIHVNGTAAGTVSLTGAGINSLRDSTPIDLVLSEEFNVIRVTGEAGDLRLRSLDFEYLGPVITTSSPLPPAVIDAPYSLQLQVAGGVAPYTWSITSGSLPSGITLDPATGILSGTPPADASATFTVTVTDAANPPAAFSKTLSLVVTSQSGTVNGLILQHSFDEGTGTAISDTSPFGNNHSTTLNDALWFAEGKSGSALGSESDALPTGGLVPANQADLNFNPRGDAFTITTWVRVGPGTNSGWFNLFEQSDSSGIQYHLRTPGTFSQLRANVGGSNATLTLPDGAVLNDGAWHLITLVNFNDNGTWRFRLYYNDGATFAQGNTGSVPLGTGTFRIGANANGFNLWRGAIDEFRVYDRDLSLEEIETIYVLGGNTSPPPPATEHTLSYSAGSGGTLSGTSPQTVADGGSGTAVTAVPDSGFVFSYWSDGSTANPRTDSNVTADVNVTAIFDPVQTPVTASRIYMIGNSLTDDILYDGFADIVTEGGRTLTLGSKRIPGSPIIYHWENPTQGFTESPFGAYPNAFANYTWDSLTLQPFSTYANELLHTRYFAQALRGDGTFGPAPAVVPGAGDPTGISPDADLYIYAQWPSDMPSDWKSATWLDPTLPGSRSNAIYHENLVTELRSLEPETDFYLIPVGHVFHELHQLTRAGRLPDISRQGDFMADPTHLNDRGSYIPALTFYSVLYRADPRGLVVPPTYPVSPEQAAVIQDAVWKIVTHHPLTGMANGLVITSPSLPDAVAGEALSHTFTHALASGAVSYSVPAETPLPTGLALSTDGVLSGTVATPGIYDLTIRAIDDSGRNSERDYILFVSSNDPPVVESSSLPNAVYGEPYSTQLTHSGGIGEVTWSLAVGDLPHGLALSADGWITGTPTNAPATFSPTFQALDSIGGVGTRVLSIQTTPAEGSTLVVPPATGSVVLDGALSETFWTLPHQARRRLSGSSTTTLDFQLHHNAAGFTLGARVVDPTSDPDDAVHLFLDGLHDRELVFNADDRHIVVRRDGSWEERNSRPSGIQALVSPTVDGYELEIHVPYSNLGLSPEGRSVALGFDLGLEDQSGSGSNAGWLLWLAADPAAPSPSSFGNLVLAADGLTGNLLVNGDFESGGINGVSYPGQATTAMAGQGWQSSPVTTRPFGRVDRLGYGFPTNAVESAGADANDNMYQVIHDARATQGQGLLRFDVKWASPDTAIRLFGYNGSPATVDANIGVTTQQHPAQGGSPSATLLATTLGQFTASATWREVALPVDFGTGYDYLILSFSSRADVVEIDARIDNIALGLIADATVPAAPVDFDYATWSTHPGSGTFLEYALGIAPNAGSPITTNLVSTTYSFSYPRAREDVHYEVETATELNPGNWTPLSVIQDSTTPVGETATARFLLNPGETRRFFRLTVQEVTP